MIFRGKEKLTIFVGDIMTFVIALYLSLIIRYITIPDWMTFAEHIKSFSFLIIVWVTVLYISGFYEWRSVSLRKKLLPFTVKIQIINGIIAMAFFYFIPANFIIISPKVNLVIYILISTILLFAWRTIVYKTLSFVKRERAILIGSGDEFIELYRAINEDNHSGIEFVHFVDTSKNDSTFDLEDKDKFLNERVSLVVADMDDNKVVKSPLSYSLALSGVKFIDFRRVYEGVFDRLPLLKIKPDWLLENISFSSKPFFDFLKRSLDIISALIIGIISLVVYPFVIALILIKDGKPIFFIQERVGLNGSRINIIKFRTMDLEGKNVTSIGKVLRKTRIDELPQLWNVLKGDMSIIGPRPEIPNLVSTYEQEIPYYGIRHSLKPGLSGWAQVHQDTPPKFAVDVDQTKIKLSYDLFYLKNRSIFLDIKIALKTLKEIFTRKGI